MLRALIFDVDGTLADTEDTHRQAFNAAFGRMDLDWHWRPDTYRQLLRVTGGKERIAHYIQTLGLPEAERSALFGRVHEIHRAKTRLYAEFVRQGLTPLRTGVRRLLAEAREAQVRLAIATTTTRENVETLLEGALGPGGMGWFDVVAAGDIVPRKKPAPDIYELALAQLGVDAAGCVAFEDSVNGLHSAQGAGLCTIVTPTPWTGDAERPLLDAAALVLSSLGDPLAPLPAAESARIGAPFVGLAQVRALLESCPAGPPARLAGAIA